MNESIRSLSHGPLELQTDLPAGFNGIRLPGASAVFASGSFGSLCIQHYRNKFYCIRYCVLNILQHFVLQSTEKQNGFFARIVLENRIKQSVNGSAEILLREGQFSALFAKSPEIITEFETPQRYSCFDTYFSPRITRELLAFFPEVLPLFNSEKKAMTFPRRVDGETRELISKVLHCHYSKEICRYFFERRVRDILFQLLVQLSVKEQEGERPSEAETDAVYAAEKIISGNLRAHLRIPEISRKVNLNEFRFKIVFRKIFGMGAYEYLQKKRLKNAKELMESGFSVKEAAAATGYRVTHFITAFREHYGFTPGSIKRTK